MSIIITVVASIVGFVSLFTLFSNDDDTGISIMSGFGEITIFDPKQPSIFENYLYYDDKLSFQLLKPNNDWNISMASESMNVDELAYLESVGFLDGVYLEKESDKLFLISVFDVKSKNFQLNDYFTRQIALMDFDEDVKVPIKQISQSNDWAIFSFDMETDADDSYAEQLLFLKNDKLYMLHYSGKSPENLTELEKSNFNSILNSFEVI